MTTRRAFVLGAFALACSKKSVSARDTGAMRIVSLSPSTTETIAAIGALSLLVGRSRYCDYPAEVASLPDVGGYVDPNFEAILSLAPSLVVGARGPAGASVVQKISSHGIETYFPETESFAHIEDMITGLGIRTHHEIEAATVIAKIRAQRDSIVTQLRAVPRVRTALLFGVTPIVLAGKNTFADEMLTSAGGENVVTTSGYPTLDIEALAALDPDAIIDAAVAEHGAQIISASAAGWRDLEAVKRSRVARITDETVLRPGPRVALGLATLARAIHPEAAVILQ